MSIQAVFFDIDGTYFDHVTNKVLPESIEAVKALKANGYKVVLCSGRALSMARKVPVFDGITWDGFIGGGGNFVYDQDFHCIWENGFHKEQLQQAFSIAKQKDLVIYATGEDNFITRDLNAKEQSLLDIFHLHTPHVHEWQGEDVHMMSLLGGKDYDYTAFTSIENTLLQPSCDEIMDLVIANGNKAIGISHLLEHLGIPQGNYMAFGDNLNDKEMLQEAAIGVAMGNCTPELKPYADYVCAPSNEPGIYQALKHFHLI